MRINHVRVRTPEGVVFTFPLAGPATRFLAWLVDGLVILTVGAIVGMVTQLVQPVSADWAMAVHGLIMFVVTVAYGIVLEWRWRGQTLGKKLLRLRVMDQAGLPLRASQLIIRNLLRAVDQLPLFYLVGGATMVLHPRAQRLGDIAAGTIVVRHRRPRAPDFGQLLGGKFNSLRALPHLAARLRQEIPPDLAAAAMDALVRRDQLDAAARIALFRELAGALRRRVPYPAEVAGDLPDETYVRNVVAIVYAAGAGPSTVARSASVPASRNGAISTASASQ